MILVAPGTPLAQGGIYRVSGSLGPLDAVVRGYYATQGIHLELRATRTVMVGRRGGLWGDVDTAHRYVLGRLGAVPAPSPPPGRLSPASPWATRAGSRTPSGRASARAGSTTSSP